MTYFLFIVFNPTRISLSMPALQILIVQFCLFSSPVQISPLFGEAIPNSLDECSIAFPWSLYHLTWTSVKLLELSISNIASYIWAAWGQESCLIHLLFPISRVPSRGQWWFAQKVKRFYLKLNTKGKGRCWIFFLEDIGNCFQCSNHKDVHLFCICLTYYSPHLLLCPVETCSFISCALPVHYLVI